MLLGERDERRDAEELNPRFAAVASFATQNLSLAARPLTPPFSRGRQWGLRVWIILLTMLKALTRASRVSTLMRSLTEFSRIDREVSPSFNRLLLRLKSRDLYQGDLHEQRRATPE